MPANIITPEDLNAFKDEMLSEIETMFNRHRNALSNNWLKSKEVVEQLGISHSTLQKLRVKGTLPYTRIGGVIYYESQDIEKLLSANKIFAIAEY